MKPGRRLSLRREVLHELDDHELARVAGATHVATDCNCLTHGNTCDACPIISLPLNTCIFTTGDLVISCWMCLQ